MILNEIIKMHLENRFHFMLTSSMSNEKIYWYIKDFCLTDFCKNAVSCIDVKQPMVIIHALRILFPSVKLRGYIHHDRALARRTETTAGRLNYSNVLHQRERDEG